MTMKSHPLIEAARAVVRDWRSVAIADELNGFKLSNLQDEEERLPQEPLAIVPCAWLVEAAEVVKQAKHDAQDYGGHDASVGLARLEAKLRGALGE